MLSTFSRRPRAFHAGVARERQQDGFGRLARSLGRRRDDSSSAAHSVACAAFLVCWEDNLRAWCWFSLCVTGCRQLDMILPSCRASCHAAHIQRVSEIFQGVMAAPSMEGCRHAMNVLLMFSACGQFAGVDWTHVGSRVWHGRELVRPILTYSLTRTVQTVQPDSLVSSRGAH